MKSRGQVYNVCWSTGRRNRVASLNEASGQRHVHGLGRMVWSYRRHRMGYIRTSLAIGLRVKTSQSMRLTPITSLRDTKDPRGDAIDLAHLRATTIDSSEIGILAWGNVPLPQFISYTAETYEKSIRNDLKTAAISAEPTDGLGCNIDRSEHLVIRDLDLSPVEPSNNVNRGQGQGRIVAHVEYVFCPPDWFSRNHHTPANPDEPVDPRIAAMNQALMDHFHEEIYRVSEVHVGGQECYMLLGIHTLATHLRRGIASELIRWIIPYANAKRRSIFLVSSPVGVHVYRKNGFEGVGGDAESIEIPLEDWGGPKGVVHHLVAMRREAS